MCLHEVTAVIDGVNHMSCLYMLAELLYSKAYTGAKYALGK